MKHKAPMKSRTIWFAILLSILSVLQGFVFTLPLDPQWQAVTGCVIAVIIVLLRYVTKAPLYADEN